MVEPWVGRLASEVGFNFGGVYAGDQQQKGELEVFVSRCAPECRSSPILQSTVVNSCLEKLPIRAGHVTDWHTDFMENFTIQARRRLAQSSTCRAADVHLLAVRAAARQKALAACGERACASDPRVHTREKQTGGSGG
jgi:hypothetical protein